MIKIVISFLFLSLLFVGSIQAQRPKTYPRNFIGAYLGPNLSGFSGDYIANIEGETGKIRLRSQYGFFGKFFINNEISIFSGLHFVLNGATTKNDDTKSATVSISYVAKTNLSTFSIPAMIAYTPREDYGILLGPQFDYILSASEPWNRSDQLKPPEYEEDVIEKFNKAGMSLALGGYYLFLNGSSLHLRYTHGLTAMTKEEFGNARPYSIQFYVGINIYKK